MGPNSQLCERARAWSSLRVDGELSDLEAALLEAHLRRCEHCRAFARDAELVASTLRITAYEPAPATLEVPSKGQARRRLQLTAAVAVAMCAGLGAALLGPHGARTAAKPVAMVAGGDSADGLRELRRPALVAQGRAADVRHRRDIGSV